MTASESRPPRTSQPRGPQSPAPAASASLSLSPREAVFIPEARTGGAREHREGTAAATTQEEPRWVLATAARLQASSFRGWRGRGRVGARADTRGSPAAGILLLPGRGGGGARRSAPARGHRGSGTSALRSGTAGSGTATQCHANLRAARRLGVDARSKAPAAAAAATATAATTAAAARGLGPADDTARIVPRLSDGPSPSLRGLAFVGTRRSAAPGLAHLRPAGDTGRRERAGTPGPRRLPRANGLRPPRS